MAHDVVERPAPTQTGTKSPSMLAVLRSTGRFGVLVALTAASIGVIYGYDLGAIAGALLFLPKHFHISTFQKQAIASSVVLGQFFGAFVGGRLANRFGRRPTLIAVAAGFIVFAILSAASWSTWSLIIFRLLLGTTIGVSIAAAPLFIAESAPAQIRGGLVATYQVANILGIAIAYFIGVAIAGSHQWRILLGASSVLAALVLIVLWRLPDTPRWYVMRGRREDAERTLAKADPTQSTETALQAIEDDLAHEERGTFGELFSRPFTMAGLWVVVFGVIVQITGINAVVFYAPTFLGEVGFKGTTGPLLGNGIVQLAGLVMAIVALGLIDRRGRRPVLMVGLTIMLLADVCLIVSFAAGQVAWLAFLGILLFVMGFDFGLGVLVWVYSSESLPSRLRGVGASALLAANLAINFIVVQFFLSAFTALGGQWVFAIFLGFGVLAVAFVLRFAPETRGRQLEEIRSYWEHGAEWPAGAATTASDPAAVRTTGLSSRK